MSGYLLLSVMLIYLFPQFTQHSIGNNHYIVEIRLKKWENIFVMLYCRYAGERCFSNPCNRRGYKMLRKLPPLLLILCLLFTYGCTINRATAKLAPGADLSNVKSFYIVEEPGDKGTGNVYKLIEANLAKRGYAVTMGPDMKSPHKFDVTLTYVERWAWDIVTYMAELTITFTDPATNLNIARGNSYHTSLTRKSPEEMVDEVLTNIFSAKPNL